MSLYLPVVTGVNFELADNRIIILTYGVNGVNYLILLYSWNITYSFIRLKYTTVLTLLVLLYNFITDLQTSLYY